MADTTLETLEAVFTRLKSYSDLTNIVASSAMYTGVPQNIAFPYLQIEITSQPWAQDDKSSMQHLVRVHSFSNQGSPAQSYNIMRHVFDAMDRQENVITISGANLVLCQFAGVKEVFREPDGKTWHGVIEFTLIVE